MVWYEAKRQLSPRCGTRTRTPSRFGEGLEDPIIVWLPSIAVTGMTFYTGDRFPHWKRNLFVGGLREGGIPGTGPIQRAVFNDNWGELRREPMLMELGQRIRDVRQGETACSTWSQPKKTEPCLESNLVRAGVGGPQEREHHLTHTLPFDDFSIIVFTDLMATSQECGNSYALPLTRRTTPPIARIAPAIGP